MLVLLAASICGKPQFFSSLSLFITFILYWELFSRSRYQESVGHFWVLEYRSDCQKYQRLILQIVAIWWISISKNSWISCNLDNLLEVNTIKTQSYTFFFEFRGVSGYRKLGGQVVMRRTAAARRCLLFFRNLGGQLPTLPTRHLRPCWLSR